MIILDVPQGSPEWFAEKAGRPGASSFNKIITTKGKPYKQRESYLYELAAEAITGIREDGFKSRAMEIGLEREAESRQYYEMLYDVQVTQVGCVYPDEQRKYLCSPDGLVCDENGPSWGLEMKNVLPKTQVAYLVANKLPTDYILQIQGSLLVTGLDRWDFFSYSPGLPPLIIKCYRDEKLISKLKEELDRFCYDLAQIVKRLREM